MQIEEWNNGSYGVSIIVNLRNKQIVFTIPDEILGTSSSTGADEAKTKIKEFFKNNKTIVCYTLQTPTEEELTPEAQKALYSILSCDEQTTIEIVGSQSSGNFILPRTLDAAISSTALCQSKINAINISSILNLESRVNKLEIDTSL